NQACFGGRLPPDIRIRLSNRMRRRLGQIRYDDAGPERAVLEIALNVDLMLHANDEHRLETMLHEMAHAEAYLLYGERGHGPRWRRIARRVGCEPRACSDVRIARRRRRTDPVTRVPPPERFLPDGTPLPAPEPEPRPPPAVPACPRAAHPKAARPAAPGMTHATRAPVPAPLPAAAPVAAGGGPPEGRGSGGSGQGAREWGARSRARVAARSVCRVYGGFVTGASGSASSHHRSGAVLGSRQQWFDLPEPPPTAPVRGSVPLDPGPAPPASSAGAGAAERGG